MQAKETSNEIMNDLGFSKSQIIVLIMVTLTGLTDGTLIQCASLPINQISIEFSQFSTLFTKQYLISMLGSNFFFGIMIGTFFAAILANKFGRRTSYLYSVVGIFICQLLTIMIPNSCPLLLIVLKLFVGIFNGITTSISFFYVIEQISSKYNNKIITFGSLPYTFGELYGILIAYLTTQLKDINWRQYYYFTLLPIAGSIAWFYLFVPETIPFLVKNNKIEDAYNQLEQNIHLAGVDPKKYQLESIKPKIVENWKQQYAPQTTKSNSQRTIFTPEIIKLTILLTVIWFVLNFVFFGTLSILSSNRAEISYFGMAVSSLSNIPTIFTVTYMVAIPSLKWKNSLVLSFFMIVLINTGIYCLKDFMFLSLITVNRFFQGLAFTLMFGFTAEVYPSYAKAIGISICMGISKFGSILMPWILQMTGSNYYASYAMFAGFSSIGLAAILAVKEKKLHFK